MLLADARCGRYFFGGVARAVVEVLVRVVRVDRVVRGFDGSFSAADAVVDGFFVVAAEVLFAAAGVFAAAVGAFLAVAVDVRFAVAVDVFVAMDVLAAGVFLVAAAVFVAAVERARGVAVFVAGRRAAAGVAVSADEAFSGSATAGMNWPECTASRSAA